MLSIADIGVTARPPLVTMRSPVVAEIDAVRVNLNHRSGSEMVFFIPYSRTATGYAFERPFKL